MRKHSAFIKLQIFCTVILIAICSFAATAQTANQARRAKPGAAATTQANNAGRSTTPGTMQNQSRNRQPPDTGVCYDILHERDMNGVAEILFDSKSRLARQQARVFWDAGDKLRGSVFTGARVSLTWLGDAKIRRFTSSTLKPINFAEMRAGKTSIFWCLPVKAIATLRPLTALVLTLTMEQLKETKGTRFI